LRKGGEEDMENEDEKKKKNHPLLLQRSYLPLHKVILLHVGYKKNVEKMNLLHFPPFLFHTLNRKMIPRRRGERRGERGERTERRGGERSGEGKEGTEGKEVPDELIYWGGWENKMRRSHELANVEVKEAEDLKVKLDEMEAAQMVKQRKEMEKEKEREQKEKEDLLREKETEKERAITKKTEIMIERQTEKIGMESKIEALRKQ
jgi:hypothetical protein